MISKKIIGIIPARYASTRFPAKPLVMIHGKTMIERVYAQAKLSQRLSDVIVATDDQRIVDVVQTFGGKVQVTATHHLNGTERCAEIAANADADIIINIQGDEPYIDPEMIDQVAALFDVADIQIASLCKKIDDTALMEQASIIKVVKDIHHKALYFSRALIPFERDVNNRREVYKHIGLYAYRKSILLELVKLKPSMLEQSESLEQLRWLENGFSIHLAETSLEADSIDTPDDLARILLKYNSDK
jgi:3-deoxy-manno-octulosonate cytidylyltransferase (CMP-KDO synthetase)